MKRRGKKWNLSHEKLDLEKLYSPDEAVGLIGTTSYSKFDGSVDASVKVQYKSLQNVRGTVQLPHGNGKTIRVLVVAKENKHAEAKEAGAEYIGSNEILDKIQKEKWTDFDACVATPDMMKDLAKLGPILGRKGLMPKPKAGTVTNDVGVAVRKLKAGFSEYRPDKTGVVHLSVGRASFDASKIKENISALYTSMQKSKPADAKGEYIKSFFISATMGPGIRVNHRLLV